MLTCTPSTDLNLIRSIITHPRVWKGASEDGAEAKEFNLPDAQYFVFKWEEELLGGCSLRYISSACAELHTLLLPSAIGRSKECFDLFSVLLLEHTQLETLITFVPKTNKLALRAAEKSGFKLVGTVTNSYRKGGRLIAQDILQVTL